MYGIHLPLFTYISTEITIGAGILTYMYLSMGAGIFTIICHHLSFTYKFSLILYGLLCS